MLKIDSKRLTQGPRGVPSLVQDLRWLPMASTSIQVAKMDGVRL